MAEEHQHLLEGEENCRPSAAFTFDATRRLVATGILVAAFVAVAVTSPATANGKDGPNSSSSFLASRPPMLGKSRKKDSSSSSDKGRKKDEGKKKNNDGGREFDCNDGKYSKRTLKTAYEMPYAALFRDTRGEKEFEASDVVKVGDDIYSVCDNSWSIFKFDQALTPLDPSNVMIGDPRRDPREESGYEAILHDGGTFYVVRESVAQRKAPEEDERYTAFVEERALSFEDDKRYTAIIEELDLSFEGDAPDYDIVRQCPSEFEFEGASTGFEGAVAARDANDDELVILGLCEGNFCSEKGKKEKGRGNGRLVAMKKETTGTDCVWKTIREIAVPSSADFLDYSSISMDPSTGRVAITSQEDSKLWVGKLDGLDADGRLDLDAAEFDDEASTVYSFQKSSDCETIYCNIEGIHFLNDEMLIGVSDKMKSKGKQDSRCFDKDQSVHVFMLP